MTPDHPHARLLAQHYAAMATALHPGQSASDGRAEAFTTVAKQVVQLLAPDFVIHTGGIRLAAHGGREFTMAMGQRRNALSGGPFRPRGELSIVADDSYAFVRGVFSAESNGRTYLAEGAGAWRFNEIGQATEHWELGPGREFDEFFIGCDPDFAFASAEEFWLKQAPSA